MNFNRVTIGSSEKIGLIGNLATMLSSGIPILDAVDSLLEDARGGQKKILETMRDDLIQGEHIHVTLAKFPRVFDRVTVSVIRASEEAGTLDITLKDLRGTIQKEMEFSDKVKTALIYPVFIIVVFLGVLLMILVVVIPKITTVFSRLHVILPLPTRILIFLSELVTQQTLSVLVGTLVVFFGGWVLFRRYRGIISNLFFSLPLVRGLVGEIDITRFSRSLHLLLASGIPIISALELTEGVVVRRKTSQVIARAREMVSSGKTLSEGLRWAKGYLPAIMIKLIEAGEKTGSLERAMQEISEYFDYQVGTTLKMLTSLLEPVLLVIVGVIVGGLMLAIISPIYGLIGQVGAR